MLYSLQAVSILFTKTLKPFLWGFTGSLLMVATQAAEETLNDSTIQKISQLERVEFAFVLLPEPSTLKEIHNVAQEIAKTLAPLSQQSQNLIWGEDCNKVVRMPHVSVGQYGLLGLELPTLSHLVSEVAQQFLERKVPVRTLQIILANYQTALCQNMAASGAFEEGCHDKGLYLALLMTKNHTFFVNGVSKPHHCYQWPLRK